MRRTSVFVCGENLGGGAIYLLQALKYQRVERPTGAEPKKKDMTVGHVFLQRTVKTDISVRNETCRPQGGPKSKPNAVGSIWKGGARERADDVFLCRGHKKTSEQSGLCSDVVREAGVEPARPCEHWHLKPASLPIPPLAQVAELRCSSARCLYYHTSARMSIFFCRFSSVNFARLMFGNRGGVSRHAALEIYPFA